MSTDHLLRGTTVLVPVGDLKPNPWNYNTQKDATFTKLANSIRRYGFTRPLIIRTLADGSKQIIDGEHGWRAAQILGMREVPCVNLGSVPDARAKEMTIVLNELGGKADDARLSALMRDIAASVEVEEIMGAMPYSQAQIDMLTSVVDFGFNQAPKGDPRPEPKPEEREAIQDKHARARVEYTGELAVEVQLLCGASPEAEALAALRELVQLREGAKEPIE